MAKVHRLRSIRLPEKPVPTPVPKKSKNGLKQEIIKKAEEDLKKIECNVLTGDCLNCPDLQTCDKANGNFTQISNALSYQLLPILSHPALKLYLYLSARAGGNYKDGNYGKSWPSNKTIAEDTGITQRHIWKYILELETLNLIKTHPSREKAKIKVRFNYVQWFAKMRNIKKLKKD